MNPFTHFALGLALAVAPTMSLAQSHPTAPDAAPMSPYAGFEAREIKSLSDEDIAALKAGEGWGLALPAELNGVPGPAHVLELAEALELSDEQRTAIERIREQMTAQAVRAGARLIQAEAMIEEGFRRGGMPPQALHAMIVNAAQARAQLRFIHLSSHLQTPYILTPEQVGKYRELRGYSAEDPCASTPEGHDPEMWRKHNNCG